MEVKGTLSVRDPSQGVAQGEGGGIGLVVGQGLGQLQHLDHGAGKLLLARPAEADYGLLDPQRSVFENGQAANGGRGKGGTASGPHDLGGLEVVYVDGLLAGKVARVPFFRHGCNRLVNFAQTLDEGNLGFELEGKGIEEAVRAVGLEFDDRQAHAPKTGIDAEDAPRVGNLLQKGLGIDRGSRPALSRQVSGPKFSRARCHERTLKHHAESGEDNKEPHQGLEQLLVDATNDQRPDRGPDHGGDEHPPTDRHRLEGDDL